MRIKVVNLVLILMVLSLKSNAKGVSAKSVHKNEGIALNPNDSAIIFMKNFYNWYKSRYKYLDHKLHLVDMNMATSAPYRINFHETDKYLSVLKSSGFFSDNYINYYKNYFNKIDSTLQKTKQNDGTVDGLDYDFIMHSQEPEAMLENLDELKLSIVKSNNYDVVIKMKCKYDGATNYQLFYLIKSNGKYLVDKIEFK